jgi:hypothetical protein
LRTIVLVATLVLSAGPAAAQYVVGGPITPAKLPPRFTTKPDLSTLTSIKAAQEAAGDLTLEKADFVGAPPDDHTSTAIVVVARKLTLHKSTMTTNGHPLLIVADEVIGDGTSRITTTPALSPRTATANGKDGVDGRAGGPAGRIEIHITGGFVGKVNFDLSGEDGESGGDGIAGRAGTPGAPGRNARARGFCRRGPGNGGNGGRGEDGGNGGDAGAGGDGGALVVMFYKRDVALDNIAYDFEGGTAGTAGAAGKKGRGGAGGRAGTNHSPCSGGAVSGARGADGKDGSPGAPAAAGKRGTLTASRVDPSS